MWARLIASKTLIIVITIRPHITATRRWGIIPAANSLIIKVLVPQNTWAKVPVALVIIRLCFLQIQPLKPTSNLCFC